MASFNRLSINPSEYPSEVGRDIRRSISRGYRSPSESSEYIGKLVKSVIFIDKKFFRVLFLRKVGRVGRTRNLLRLFRDLRSVRGRTGLGRTRTGIRDAASLVRSR